MKNPARASRRSSSTASSACGADKRLPVRHELRPGLLRADRRQPAGGEDDVYVGHADFDGNNIVAERGIRDGTVPALAMVFEPCLYPPRYR